ncbi:MAG TPA: VOC family protein [Accumulibacter sp.]|nr:VOC family protein [Accumulibacter sp.]HMW16295.1 VOC family protein [Accumulibacter sp.]HMX22176.1 VOC family protein [Accumulibacter sp.]HMY05806.1 VOC family protein [Accumulibacter sp.]HNC16942.1 VOC family protein [Accumulibacter sp.]
MDTLTNNPVAWFEIYVSDMDRARTFYTTVFRRPLTALSGQAAGHEIYLFESHDGATGIGGALVKHPMTCPGKGGALVYFSCQDVAVEAQRALEAGGLIARRKTPIGEYGFVALVEDTEGNLIGLHSKH